MSIVTDSEVRAMKAPAQIVQTVLPVDHVMLGAAMTLLRLSPREVQIVQCLLEFTDDEKTIAARLGLSAHTVHSHFDRMYRKLRVSSRCQLVCRLLVAYSNVSVPSGGGQDPPYRLLK
jgi:DNA-binding NarL/FixJ family response regulator